MHFPFLKEMILFLVIAGMIVPVMARLRLNPVLGFLLAGVAAGPYGVARLPGMPEIFSALSFSDPALVRLLGEFGIVFLLFLIGIELSPARLFAMRRLIFGLGTAQVAACTAIIGLIAWAWGNSVPGAIILGLCLSLSSTAVVMQMIMDKGHFLSPVGQTSFSVLLLQDLAVVPVLFLVPLLAGGVSAQGGLALLGSFAAAAAAMAAVFAAGKMAARPALRFVSASRGSREYFIACVFLTLLLSALATEYAGLSMAMGAFLAGMVFAETEFRNQIEIDIEPFRGLLMGLFFMSVGMTIDVMSVFDNLFWLFAGVAGLFFIKALVIGGLCMAFGLRAPTAVRTGITLGQAGEFAFIIVGMALHAGIMPPSTAQFMIMLTALTLALTPFAYRFGEYCERLLLRRAGISPEEALSEASKDISGHVVIAGFGRTGQAVAKALEENQVPYLALDIDGANLDSLRRQGQPVFLGDASNIQALQKVHAGRARAIVLALDDRKAAQRTIKNLRRQCPQATIYARAHDEAHARALQAEGVSAVVLEIEGVSQYLAKRVLDGVG